VIRVERMVAAGDLGQRGQDGKGAVFVMPDPPHVLESMTALVDDLATDHLVIAAEGPGFGFSTASAGFRFTPAQQADVIEDVLTHGVRDATVVMTCVGSLYAAEIAARRPDLVGALVLGQAPGLAALRAWAIRMDKRRLLRTPVLGQTVVRLGRRKIADGWIRYAAPKGSDIEPLARDAKAALASGGLFSLASAFQSLLRHEVATPAPVRQPVAMLWGSADRSHKRTDPQAVTTWLPHATVTVLDGCGHFPDLERPADMARAVRDVDRR
jgi:pimeloyl-ACP methyl ester carboxylesterase